MIIQEEISLLNGRSTLKHLSATGYKLLCDVHRDEKEAKEFIAVLLPLLYAVDDSVNPKAGNKSRHSRILAARGFDVIGNDYPFHSRYEKRDFDGHFHTFFTDDMRKLFVKGYFNYVFNLYTSFGSFNKAEHIWTVLNLAAAIAKGGLLVLDYPDTDFVIKNMTPISVQENDGIVFGMQHECDDDFVYRNIKIFNHLLDGPLEYSERICRLKLHDFDQMFSGAGLELEQLFGDYSFGEYEPGNSPRMIMIARKVG